jgi:hypothetical protein
MIPEIKIIYTYMLSPDPHRAIRRLDNSYCKFLVKMLEHMAMEA